MCASFAQDLKYGIQFNKKNSLDEIVERLGQNSTYAKPTGTVPQDNLGDKVFATVKVPFSRSLQGKNSSLDHPRKVAAVPSENLGDPPSYLGFVQGTNNGEAMLWNGKTEQYDFKLVKRDEKTGAYNLTNPPPNQCAACHQNNGPIFSEFPWGDTEFSGSLAYAMNHFQPLTTAQNDAITTNVPAFDESVRSTNLILQRKKLCKSFCDQNDGSCLKKLLFAEIASTKGQEVEIDRSFAQRASSFLKATDFGYISSSVPSPAYGVAIMGDRNIHVISSTKISYLLSREYTNAPEDCTEKSINKLRDQDRFGYEHTANFTGVFGFIRCREVNPKFPSSPLYKRPIAPESHQTIDTITKNFNDVVRSCFGLSPALQKVIKTKSLKELAETFQRPACLNGLFYEGKLDDVQFERAISSKCFSKKKTPMPVLACSTEKLGPVNKLQEVIDSASKVQGIPVLTLQERSRAHELFQSSCASCHGKNQGIELDVDWTDFDSIKQYRMTSGLKAVDRISAGEMPADHSISNEDSHLLIKALSQ